MLKRNTVEWLLRIVGISEIFIGGINFATYGSVWLSLGILTMGILCVCTADRIGKYNG